MCECSVSGNRLLSCRVGMKMFLVLLSIKHKQLHLPHSDQWSKYKSHAGCTHDELQAIATAL